MSDIAAFHLEDELKYLIDCFNDDELGYKEILQKTLEKIEVLNLAYSHSPGLPLAGRQGC